MLFAPKNLIFFLVAMHKAWPRLLKRMNLNKGENPEDRELVIAARTWFCLYLFEHQYVLSFYRAPTKFIVSVDFPTEQAALLS